MATTRIYPVRVTEIRAVAYDLNPSKTEQGLFTEHYCCSTVPSEAVKAFEAVRAGGTGRGKILAQQIIQSFRPGEVTPEQAIQIGMELCERLLKGEYQYVIATHTDREHIHNHILFNNVNMKNGRTFETLENRHKESWQRVRQISDDLCQEYGLSVIENPERNKGKTWYEWSCDREGLSWKSKLKNAIDSCIMESASFEELLENLRRRNIEVVYNPSHVIDLKFRYPGEERFSRARSLGWYYETPQLKRRISYYQLLKTGQLSYQRRTRIIDTTSERFQNAKGLQRWADIQNMKEASRIINLMTTYGIGSTQELESRAITEYTYRMGLVEELNGLQKKIDVLSDALTALKRYKKYKPVHDEYKAQPPMKKKAFAKRFVAELDKFEAAKAELKALYPSGKVPSSESLTDEHNSLIEQRNEKNAEYKRVISVLKDLDYARKTIAEYLKNERAVEEQKRKKGDLE